MTRNISLLIPLLLILTHLHAQSTRAYAVVIDEIFADPSPPIGLPPYEYIEIKNTSHQPVNLLNWRISDGNSTAIIQTRYLLQPDSFLILCSNPALGFYLQYGPALSVNGFPSLNNESDIISVYGSDGRLIHSVAYHGSWYQNDIKREGGWSLEMIDPLNPCGELNNWKASTHPKGGTPGFKNAVNADNKDDQLPALLRTYFIDSIHIVAVFDEALDSSTAGVAGHYQVDGRSVLKAFPAGMMSNEVLLTLQEPLLPYRIYELQVKNILDCAGNETGSLNRVKTGRALEADSFAVAINEVLFNPVTDGYDFIEFYNRSNRILDTKRLLIANQNDAGQLSNIVSLNNHSFLLFPGEYLAITENRQWIRQHYPVKDISTLQEIEKLPALPDDRGSIVLMNAQGERVDALSYRHDWHFPLLENKEGVSLERMDYNKATGEKDNWTSATEMAGKATPGYENSQFRADRSVNGQVTILPSIFSPDQDGYNDFAFIQYQFEEPGYMAGIDIYDVQGRLVKTLAVNLRLSAKGSIRWDGLNDRGQSLAAGNYIILTRIFNLKGLQKKFKSVVTLARRMN